MPLTDVIKKDAKAAKWVGVFLLITGLLSIAAPFAAGLSAALMVGALMLVSGISQLFLVFRAGSFVEGFLLVLVGILSVVAGGYMVSQPGAALATLTLLLAGFFVASGVLEVIAAFSARPSEGWGMLLAGGLLSLLLGVMIWLQFPMSGVWAVGVLVGVKLSFAGLALMTIGSAVKDVAAE